ncbi:MAG: family 16 glycoside hydrolase [Chloroflexota bacterium]|nr:family 16 glycoside hydrolase [Anaerolineales bacterium]
MNQPIENDKSFLRNDRKLVCSMLLFYGLCILGLVGATFWGLDHRNKTVSANATSTAAAVATQQARTTSTAIARATEHAQYEFVDRFSNNEEEWMAEIVNDEYMTGSVKIISGVYLWDAQKVKKPFVYWASFHDMEKFKDFDVYVDSKITDEQPGDACSGLVFRAASTDWEMGAYVFSVCSNSTFSVYYYEKGDWESILRQTYSDAIRNSDWNRLEISARGDDFTFGINNEVVFEMTDDRQSRGGLAVYIEVNEKSPVSISFDNFGLQPR